MPTPGAWRQPIPPRKSLMQALTDSARVLAGKGA
jgi:hypothetical protein